MKKTLMSLAALALIFTSCESDKNDITQEQNVIDMSDFYGCPSYLTVNCRSNDMTMNYMDYVNDACMYMFSEGQKVRMRSIFQSGGPRAAMAN